MIPNGCVFPAAPIADSTGRGDLAPREARLCEDRPVVPADIHEFFTASAGVAGALVGLLFVAISVSGERLAKAEAAAQLLRIRAYAALITFTNALAVSLFALLPGDQIGGASLVLALVGLFFVAGSSMSLVRLRQLRSVSRRDVVFFIGLVVLFVYQLVAGISVALRPSDSNSVDTIGVLVVACFLIGVARAWELIGGPSIGFGHEFAALLRGETAAANDGTNSAPADKPPG